MQIIQKLSSNDPLFTNISNLFKGQIQGGETFQYLAEYKIMIIDLETFNTNINNQQIEAISKISKRIHVSNFINNVHFLPLYFYPSPPKKKKSTK